MTAPDPASIWKEAHRSPLPGVRDPAGAYRLYDSQLAFAGRLLKVFRNRIRLPNGHETEHELLLQPEAVVVIPLLEETPGRPEVVLLEQFRSTVEGYLHEVPAGTLDPGEEPFACARRELLEETGYQAERWTPIASVYPMVGVAAGRMHYFLAEGLRKVKELHLDPGECLEVRRFPLDPLLESVVLRRTIPGIPCIADAKTCIALFYLGALRSLRPPGAAGQGGAP